SEILLYSSLQYGGREAWNREHSEYHWVPEPFDDTRCTEWTEARTFTTGNSRFVPAAYCYMWYTFREGPGFCASDTNGCAAGATLEEAVLHAFLELVERDAVAIWWYNRIRRPELDLATFRDVEILMMRDALAKAGRTLHLLDLT